MLATPTTRSGCWAARSSDHQALEHRPTRRALSTPTASITASVSAAKRSSRYISGSSLRSERPLPLGSIVTTRAYREKYGTCAFQARACTIGSIGAKTIVRGPSPYTS